MTISNGIIEWLGTNATIDINAEIDTDRLAAAAEAYGLYKTPQTVVRQYMNGDRNITAYYQFLVKQRAIHETKRQENQQWLEDIERWIFTQNRSRNLPSLGNNRTCEWVKIANTFYMQEADEREAVYQLVIAINYSETID